MKFLILLAAAGSATLLHDSINTQSLLARDIRFSAHPLLPVSLPSSRNPDFNTPQLLRRGFGSKLAKCFGRLCGKHTGSSDQSNHGPRLTSNSRAPSDQLGDEIAPAGHIQSAPGPSNQIRRVDTPRPRSPTSRAPTTMIWRHREAGPNRAQRTPSTIQEQNSQERNSFHYRPPRRSESGSPPMPVAIGVGASPSSWTWYRRLGVSLPSSPSSSGDTTDEEHSD